MLYHSEIEFCVCIQAVEQLLYEYRACLPYAAWRDVCMHYMRALECNLPAEDTNSAPEPQRNTAQSHAAAGAGGGAVGKGTSPNPAVHHHAWNRVLRSAVYSECNKVPAAAPLCPIT